MSTFYSSAVGNLHLKDTVYLRFLQKNVITMKPNFTSRFAHESFRPVNSSAEKRIDY